MASGRHGRALYRVRRPHTSASRGRMDAPMPRKQDAAADAMNPYAPPMDAPTGAEEQRLAETWEQGAPWYRWGPYVSARQWGTVREDYSADGQAWCYLPHDLARSRAYRWGEDGIAGFCDDLQLLCLEVARWNGGGPTLTDRISCRSGPAGSPR